MAVLRESYAPVLLARKATRLRSMEEPCSRASILQSLLRAVRRPLKLLLFSPLMLLFSLLMGLANGLMYVLYTTLPAVFKSQYGFATGASGLAFLGAGVGTFIGLGILIAVGDRWSVHLAKGGERKPEYRLPPLLLGYWLFPAGFFVFGWSAQFRVHWIVPIISNGLTGIGVISVYVRDVLTR